MRKYQSLSYEQRVRLEQMLNDERSIAYIAASLGVDRSTVYREIRREVPKNWSIQVAKSQYKAIGAQYDHNKKFGQTGRKSKLTQTRALTLKAGILKGWRPEQIVNTEPSIKNNMSVATVYNYINHNKIPGIRNDTHLPMRGKRYRRSINKQLKRERIKRSKEREQEAIRLSMIDRPISIEKRPKVVNSRVQFGHWEMDGVESGGRSKELLITFLERKSRYSVIIIAKSKSAQDVTDAVTKFLERYIETGIVKSITSDNGKEFTNLAIRTLFATRDVKHYVTHTYAAWERGSNERFNRSIRRFFPKGTSFKEIHQSEVDIAAQTLNDEPLNVLNWKTPNRVFQRGLSYFKKSKKN